MTASLSRPRSYARARSTISLGTRQICSSSRSTVPARAARLRVVVHAPQRLPPGRGAGHRTWPRPAAAHGAITAAGGSSQSPTDLAHFGDDARHKGVPRPPRARPWWTWPDPEAFGRLAISRAHRGPLWDKAEQHAVFGVWQRHPPIQQHGAEPRRVPHQPLCRQPSNARRVRTLQSCPRSHAPSRVQIPSLCVAGDCTLPYVPVR